MNMNNRNSEHERYCTAIGLQTLLMQIIALYDISVNDIIAMDNWYLSSKIITTGELRGIYIKTVNHWINIQHYVTIIDRLYDNAKICLSEIPPNVDKIRIEND